MYHESPLHSARRDSAYFFSTNAIMAFSIRVTHKGSPSPCTPHFLRRVPLPHTTFLLLVPPNHQYEEDSWPRIIPILSKTPTQRDRQRHKIFRCFSCLHAHVTYYHWLRVRERPYRKGVHTVEKWRPRGLGDPMHNGSFSNCFKDYAICH